MVHPEEPEQEVGGGSTWRTGLQVIVHYHIHHGNSNFQDLHQDVVHPGELEQEVGVTGGQCDRLQVIVPSTLIILTVFVKIYIKMWGTQALGPRGTVAGGGSTLSTG